MMGRPKSKDWTSPTQVCTKCPGRGPQPLENFYRIRKNPNGRAAQCKECTQQVRISKIIAKLPRKECKIATVWKATTFQAREMVWRAICDGVKDVAGIKARTKLTEDQIYDAIAELYSDGMLDRESLRQRVYKVAA